MKKKLKIYTLRNLILIVIFFSLIKSTDFFKKIYFLSVYNYNTRIVKNYSFCKKGSIPFLHSLKRKYKLKQKIKTIDYDINPSSDWVLFNINNDNIYKDKLILLNYRKQDEIKFVKLQNYKRQDEIKFVKSKKGLFIQYGVGNANPPYRSSIKKAIFSTNHNINKISLEITNRTEDNTILLLSKNFIFEDQSNEIELNLDLEKFNIRLGKLFIKISNKENNLENIEKVKLILVPNYDLDNFRILEKVDNCYFLERLS